MSKKKFIPGKKANGVLFSAAYVHAFASIQKRINPQDFQFDHTELIGERPIIYIRHKSGGLLSISYDEIIYDEILVEGKVANKGGELIEHESWFDFDDPYSALIYVIEKLTNKKLK